MKLTEMKNVGLANDEIRKQLEETTNNLTPNKQKLNRLINDAVHQSKKKERNERSYFWSLKGELWNMKTTNV